MISIIICSRTSSLCSSYIENVENTIGAEYELVVIDNSNNSHSIFEAYAEGVKRAQGDILCFVHDDVFFKSEKWGSCLEDIFQDDAIGMVGVAGTYFLPCMPSSWWDPETRSDYFIQGFSQNEIYKTVLVQHRDPHEADNSVVAIDGVFMAMPARVFQKVAWDTKSFKGFHCYDTDMSLQIVDAGYKIMITRDILIEHKSPGNCSRPLYEAQKILFEKWKSNLPIYRGIDMTLGEIEARTRLVELKRSDVDIKGTLEYRLGSALLHPIQFIKRHI